MLFLHFIDFFIIKEKMQEELNLKKTLLIQWKEISENQSLI